MQDEATYRQRSREAMTEQDLGSARKAGKTYNQYHKDSFERDRAAGILNSDAIKAGKAYELDSPADVRARVDNRSVGAGRGNVNPPSVGHNDGPSMTDARRKQLNKGN